MSPPCGFCDKASTGKVSVGWCSPTLAYTCGEDGCPPALEPLTPEEAAYDPDNDDD